MGQYEEQINIELLNENVNLKNRIKVLEAEVARTEGRMNGLRSGLEGQTQVVQILTERCEGHLKSWHEAQKTADKLLAAGWMLEQALGSFVECMDEPASLEAKAAIAAWSRAIQ